MTFTSSVVSMINHAYQGMLQVDTIVSPCGKLIVSVSQELDPDLYDFSSQVSSFLNKLGGPAVAKAKQELDCANKRIKELEKKLEDKDTTIKSLGQAIAILGEKTDDV